jgi:hypothetical protein
MALVLGLVWIQFLPRILPADPTERLVRSVVAEHTRALMWGARRPEVVPTALPWLTQESGIGLTNLRRRRLAHVRRGGTGIPSRGAADRATTVTETVSGDLCGAACARPANPGVAARPGIQNRWRSGLASDGDSSAWVWRQGDLACFIVSDMVSGVGRRAPPRLTRALRVATEPVPAK